MNILVISSSDGIAVELLRVLRANGHRGYLLDMWLVGGLARRSRFCCGHVSHILKETSSAQVSAALEAVNSACKRHSIDVAIPAGMWATYFVARNRTRITWARLFPTASAESIELLYEKARFADLLRQLDVPFPRTIRAAEIEKLTELRFPVLFKPTASGASEGIVRCATLPDAQRFFAEDQARFPAYIAQEFIEGMDVSAGAFAMNGVVQAFTLSRRDGNHVRFLKSDFVLDMVRRIVRATSYSGPINFDLIARPASEDYLFLECNPRFWAGFFDAKFVGIDFLAVGLQALADEGTSGQAPFILSEAASAPRQAPLKFVRGMLSGKFGFRDVFKSGHAWQTLSDPVPVAMALWRRRVTRVNRNDTYMIEAYREQK